MSKFAFFLTLGAFTWQALTWGTLTLGGLNMGGYDLAGLDIYVKIDKDIQILAEVDYSWLFLISGVSG